MPNLKTGQRVTRAELFALEYKPKNKYGAVKTKVDGVVLDSKREAKRYGVLMIMQKAGLIQNLKLKVEYTFEINGKLLQDGRGVPRKYISDFDYTQHGHQVVEDCKGVRTPVYTLKRDLMRHVNGIIIHET